MMRLVVEKGNLSGHGFDLRRSTIVIGRGRDCDIILNEHQVSRQHARLQKTSQGWMLTDLGSTNGTQVNGRPLMPHEPHALQAGDRVSLGACVLNLRSLEAAPAAASASSSRSRGKPRPALLIGGALLIAIVLVGVAVAVVVLLQDKEEATAPDGPGPLDQLEEVIEIPTVLEGITTALPIPTQLEEIVTGMPIPTGFDEMATSFPVPTGLQELVTAIPQLPMLPPGTPPPVLGASRFDIPAQASSKGAGQ